MDAHKVLSFGPDREALLTREAGTFFANFIPSIESSRWAGDTGSVNGTLRFTADLREDIHGNLNGTMSFSGSSLFTDFTVTGNQVGSAVRLRDSTGIFDAFGNTNDQATTSAGTTRSLVVPVPKMVRSP